MAALSPFHRRLANPSDDLGLGLRTGRLRAVNKDGTFNVRRVGMAWFRPFELYHQLITMSLPRFILVLLVGYILTNLLFASLYAAVGMEHFQGAAGGDLAGSFLDAFFFSAQTLTTVGNGHIHPVSPLANGVAAVESMLGLMGFALACGLLYGRFSRPHARILFSRQAVITPLRGHDAFIFRIVNERSNQLIEVSASISLSFNHPETGTRSYHALTLERPRINVFPSNWNIVHSIDAASPLANMGEQELRNADAEFIVLIKAFDDTFAQTVFARSSYKADEIVWGKRFVPMVSPSPQGQPVMDLRLLDAMEDAGPGPYS